MRLRTALLLALVAGAAGAALLGLDLHRNLNEAGAVPGAEPRVLTLPVSAGATYFLALGAVAVANLTAILLLVAALREERAGALLAVRAVAAPPPALPAAAVEPAAASAAWRSGVWGTLAPWGAEHEKKLCELWNRACTDVYRACPKEETAFGKFLGSPEFDAESSAAAVASDGSLAGVVLALRQARLEDDGWWWLESPAVVAALLVDPARRRQGIGRALLRHAETHALQRRRPRVFAGGLENFPHLVPGVPDQDYAARMFFTAQGYREVRRTCHMETVAGAFAVPAELVDREAKLRERGYTVAPGSAADAAAFERFLQSAHLDRPARRLEKFTNEPERFYLAWKDGQIAGFLHVAGLDERGHSGIHLIYFQREHRGVGLGSLLLVKAHELWKALGASGATIWTYPEAAARFYPRAGFKTVQEWVCYQKELPHSWQDSAFATRWR